MSESKAENGCIRLEEFEVFLKSLKRESGSSGGSDELKSSVPIVTRANNDSYPVNVDELPGEIRTTIWNNLHAKRCPLPFRIGIVRAVTHTTESDCLQAKECQLFKATRGGNNKKTEQTINEDEDNTIADEAVLQFDLIKLQKFVSNELEKFLTRLTDNNEAANLRNYAIVGSICDDGMMECQCTGGNHPVAHVNKCDTGTLVWPCSVAGFIKNKPRKMEDRHICLDYYSEMYSLAAPYSFYGVFDGHSGSLAATYAAAQLPYLLAQRLQPLSMRMMMTEAATFCEALESAFLQTDTQFARKGLTSGSTAVCALLAHATSITPRRLYVAWVGDSKALLVSPTASLQLVKPHKPDGADERKRIESAGGAVLYVQGQMRVNGILNVSRSIGDSSVNAVIAEPDCIDVPLTHSHDFLILGTDGLWDHVTESDVVATVYESLANVELTLEEIPRLLMDMAKRNDSQDNITVIFVLLKDRARIIEHYRNA